MSIKLQAPKSFSYTRHCAAAKTHKGNSHRTRNTANHRKHANNLKNGTKIFHFSPLLFRADARLPLFEPKCRAPKQDSVQHFLKFGFLVARRVFFWQSTKVPGKKGYCWVPVMTILTLKVDRALAAVVAVSVRVAGVVAAGLRFAPWRFQFTVR
jgi:hypothetical protein